jgi:hypothetical protein
VARGWRGLPISHARPITALRCSQKGDAPTPEEMVMARGLLILSGIGITVLTLGGATTVAQRTPAPGPSKDAGRAVPKTAWGHPDLQGVWDQTTGTPLERPDQYKNRKVLTDAEAADRERLRFAEFDENGRAGGTGDYGSVWREQSKNALNRTALIVDPEDGRIPPLTAAAQQDLDARMRARRARGEADSWHDRSLWERCITRGTPRIPNNYNSNWHILQTEQHVVILQEMIHETRVIPLDGRPHVAGGVRQWLGDSRGRWDNDTLVVETTNFSEKAEFRGFALNNARLIEKFRRLGPDRMDYEFTIDDPSVYTKPWTVSLPFILGTQYFEYACHEGNYGLPNILSGARAVEQSER